MTTEATCGKLAYLFGKGLSPEQVRASHTDADTDRHRQKDRRRHRQTASATDTDMAHLVPAQGAFVANLCAILAYLAYLARADGISSAHVTRSVCARAYGRSHAGCIRPFAAKSARIRSGTAPSYAKVLRLLHYQACV
eukprot:668266-Rhodomonas_salina.1